MQRSPLASKNPLAPKRMIWHTILIYGVLWLMAFMNLFNGMLNVFGVQFGPGADGGLGIALHVYPDMAHARIFILDGVFALAMCLYTILVRFQLAGFKRRAPMLLTILFVLNITESIAYAVVLYLLVPAMAEKNNALPNLLSMGFFWALMVPLNHIYYLRRSELFNR